MNRLRSDQVKQSVNILSFLCCSANYFIFPCWKDSPTLIFLCFHLGFSELVSSVDFVLHAILSKFKWKQSSLFENCLLSHSIGIFQKVIAFIKKNCHCKWKSVFYLKHVSISVSLQYFDSSPTWRNVAFIGVVSGTMAPEVKSRNVKTRRLSGQTLRLRKKRWELTGLKADKKNVGELF